MISPAPTAPPVQENLNSLATDPERGLSTTGLRKRQQQYGLNRTEARKKIGWQRLPARFRRPISQHLRRLPFAQFA